MFLFLLLASCWRSVAQPPGDASGGPTWVEPGRRDPKWANARCNDGTPFGYDIRKGKSSTWVINLSGGSFCEDDRIPCSERKPRLTTGRAAADGARVKIKAEGVFSRERSVNPTFADANQVDAHYCSSDLWFGDSIERQPTTGDPRNGWYFSGRENIRVLLEALVELEGLDPTDKDTRILLLGTSAGGAGVMGNLGQFQKAFPKVARSGRMKIVLDGSWVPTPPEGLYLPDAGKWGPIEPDCDRDLRARGEDPRRCILGPVWWPYVEKRGIPALIQISGLDLSQTQIFGVDTPKEIAAWRQSVRRGMAGVPWVFSGGEPYHIVAIERFEKGPPGSSFREVLDRFWTGRPPEQVWFAYPP